jgi:hypothetical protein
MRERLRFAGNALREGWRWLGGVTDNIGRLRLGSIQPADPAEDFEPPLAQARFEGTLL